MWIETQDGDLLDTDRYRKIERVRTYRENQAGDWAETTSRIAAYVSNEEWDDVAGPLTSGEANAFMGHLAGALAANTDFDTRETLREIRAEISKFHGSGRLDYAEADAQDAKGGAVEH